MSIDLRMRGLPASIAVGGEWVPVETGFRAWLDFGEALRSGCASLAVFPGGAPDGDWMPAAMEFYESRNEFPRGRGGSGAVDMLLDGDYIAAAFQQAYGIDLTDPATDMHWHRFLALFRGLPEDTLMSKIMGWRTWRKPDRKPSPDREARERREAWALPERGRVSYAEQADPLAGMVNDDIPEAAQHG